MKEYATKLKHIPFCVNYGVINYNQKILKDYGR